MSDLNITYLGVDVPERYHADLDSVEWANWKAGVQDALAFADDTELMYGINPKAAAPIPADFRVLIDGDNDLWYEVSRDVFVIPDPDVTPEDTYTRHAGVVGTNHKFISDNYGIKSERPRV